ncbi:MAG: 7-cyano-7-deazaguanine synthase, partial [candidate division WOR-3 bacterium]
MSSTINNKIDILHNVLKKHSGVVVAFSGGVDSTLLLKIATDVLGNKVIAVTATSPLYPETELKIARQICRQLRIRHLVIQSKELKNKNFTRNSVARCYYCKIDLFKALKKIAEKKGYTVIEAS